jgi:hypothetical protein
MSGSTNPSDEQFLNVVLACIEVNVSIMTRTAHKGEFLKLLENFWIKLLENIKKLLDFFLTFKSAVKC